MSCVGNYNYRVEYGNDPLAKLKSSGVEDQSKDPFAKLKSSGVESLTDREIFTMWHAFWDGIIKYRSEDEENQRFSYFQQAIVDRPPTQYEARYNLHFYADRSKEELEGIFFYFPQNQKPNAFIFKSDIESWPKMAQVGFVVEGSKQKKLKIEEPTDSSPKVEDQNDPFVKLKFSGVASLTDREIFDLWRVMWQGQITYSSDHEIDQRFLYFKERIIDSPDLTASLLTIFPFMLIDPKKNWKIFSPDTIVIEMLLFLNPALKLGLWTLYLINCILT